MVNIKDFYLPADGLDYLPAINRAQASVHYDPNQPGLFGGITLLFEQQEYYFSDTIQLIRGMSLTGSGGASDGSGTRFRFDGGVHGIICHRPDSAPSLTPGRGDFSIVERIFIYATSKGNAPTAHGFVVYAPISIRDVHVAGFNGNGIHIDASIEEGSSLSASLWEVNHCRIDGCAESGLFVTGTDTNAGLAIGVSCTSNGNWGFVDDSFLGNTYIACHAAGNGHDEPDPNATSPATATVRVGGGYKSNFSKVAVSMYLNCYCETDQPDSQIDSPSIVIGGAGLMINGDAAWMRATIGGALFRNGVRGEGPKYPLRSATAAILGTVRAPTGGSDTVYNALELHRLDENDGLEAKPYAFQYDPNSNWWQLNEGQEPRQNPIRFSTAEATEGPGQLWLENGFYMGRIDNRRFKITADMAPPTGGNPTVGDRVLNSLPTPGGFEGWVCVQVSPTVVWKGFGAIEN